MHPLRSGTGRRERNNGRHATGSSKTICAALTKADDNGGTTCKRRKHDENGGDTMMLCCSSPMVPGTTLTEKAELLKQWGYEGIAVFQPLDTWDDKTRRELTSLQSRTGVRPVEFVLTDD